MATAGDKVTFELKDGFNRVEIAVQESDRNLVMEAPHTTSDLAEIAALDASPGVKRAAKADKDDAAKGDGK
jgi:hypothetical protein